MYEDSDSPWEHPEWSDLHDAEYTAGASRDLEQYRELVLALPPLSQEDHYADLGTGTGKVAARVLEAYPKIGRVSLIDPNGAKLDRAQAKIRAMVPGAMVEAHVGSVGFQKPWLPARPATIVTVGNVLMPAMIQRRGNLVDGLGWCENALKDILDVGVEGSRFYFLEILAEDWNRATLKEPVRRLKFQEYEEVLEQAGVQDVECCYRYRDRVVFRGRRGN